MTSVDRLFATGQNNQESKILHCNFSQSSSEKLFPRPVSASYFQDDWEKSKMNRRDNIGNLSTLQTIRAWYIKSAYIKLRCTYTVVVANSDHEQ